MKVQELIHKLQQFDSDGDVKIEISDRLRDIETRTDLQSLKGKHYFDNVNEHLVSEVILLGRYK